MSSELHSALRIDDPDGFYDQLVEMHRDLGAEESQVANAKLVLLLANHIGDRKVLEAAIAVVRQSV